MNLVQFTVIVTKLSEFFLCCPVDKSWMLLIPYNVGYMFLNMSKIYVNFIAFNAVSIYENALTKKYAHTS